MSSFDLSTPSMRKVDYGEKTEKEKNVLYLVTNVVASRRPNANRLERRMLVPKLRPPQT